MSTKLANPFTEEERTEIIHAVRKAGKWHFAGERVTPMWKLVLTDDWEHLQDAPYYRQFYKYLIDELNGQPDDLVEVRAYVTYRYASIPEKNIRAHMNDWRDDWATDKLTEFKGAAVQVSQRGEDPDHLVSICLMTPRFYEIIPLDE